MPADLSADLSAAVEVVYAGGIDDRLASVAAAALGPPTIGWLAELVRSAAARPQEWWHLVRFDADSPVRARVDAEDPYGEVWLVVWPPGYRADQRADQRAASEVLTVVAGERAEHTITAEGAVVRPLRPNRVRVHGCGHLHEVTNPGPAYAVSLHAYRPCR